MSRTLTRPMFRKGGMAQREKYMGGGITTPRIKRMGGGLTGIMSGIRPDAGLTPRVGYQEGTPPGLLKRAATGGLNLLKRGFSKAYNLIPEEGIGTILARNFPRTAAVGKGASIMTAPFLPTAGIAAANYPVYPKGHPQEGEFMSKEDAREVLEGTGGASSMATGKGVQAGGVGDIEGEAAMFDLETGEYPNKRYATKIDYKSPEVVKVTNQELGLGDQDESNKKKKKIVTEEKELQKKSDLESIYGDLLPMIEKELGSDPDDTKRQLYVQLAQAGANLLAQPGGDLVGAIGKATKDPISNVGKVLEKESATDREAKLLAFKLAADRASPGETGRLIQDLKNEGYSNEEISKIIQQRQPGAGYRASADLAELGSLQEELNNEFTKVTKGKDVPLNTARDLKVAMDNFGMGASDFKVLPKKEDRVPGEYYFDPKTRKIGRLSEDGKKLIRPSEPGFMDQPEQE